jgi:hypothetical protein
MKKNYLFVLAIYATLFSANAQLIEDDFESYTLGDMGVQNPAVWSSSSGNPLIDNALTVVIDGNGGQIGYLDPATGQDALLVLGNYTTGKGILFFDALIPAGSTAYFNIQGQTETNGTTGHEGIGNGGAGIFNSSNLIFNKNGVSPGVFVDETTGETGVYPEDEWFYVTILFDLIQSTYEIEIDDNQVHAFPVPFQGDSVLGGIHFFDINGNYNLFIDNVVYGFPIIAANEDIFLANIKIYPNPVQNVLTIDSTEPIDDIQVFDALGKLILEAYPNAISPSINMSPFSSGVYLLKVTIDGASKTVKIIK